MTIEEAKERFEYAVGSMEDAERVGSSADLKSRRQTEAAEWAAIYLALKESGNDPA